MERRGNTFAGIWKMWVAVRLFFIYAWITKLADTDSFFSVYSVTAICGVFCMYINRERNVIHSTKVNWEIGVFSLIFSLSVVGGNYALFQPVTAMRNLLDIALCICGGGCICTEILICLTDSFPIRTEMSERSHVASVYFMTFGCAGTVALVYLFTAKYPAIVNYDSLAQIKQVLGLSPYNNWNPYWHTRTIGLFFDLGLSLFSDLNAALAFYTVCQTLFICACFAYVQTTFYQAGASKGFLLLTFYLYTLLPYNIAFTITIGKDVLFGIGLLLMLTALYRILTRTGKHQMLNYVFFVLGSLGFSLWRTNGYYTYLITGVILIPILIKKFPAVLYTMAGVSMVCWILLNPYLETQGVSDGPFTETMAVPFQQIAKVIANERELPEEDEKVLREMFDFEIIQEQFLPNTVDPIKFDALRHGSEYYKENLGVFLRVWLRIGFRYPGDYLTAWIDMTRGYWTGGFLMGVNDKGIPKNDIGLYNTGGDNIVAKMYLTYFRCIEDAVVLEPLKSIGFVVWLIWMVWWAAVMKKRLMAVMAIPSLIIMVALWFGAPVFAEFRYSYPLFVISPLLLFVTIYQTRQEIKEQPPGQITEGQP